MSTEHLAALIEEELHSTTSDPPSAILRVNRPMKLTNRQKDLVRALACVMWADGNASAQERRLIEQVIDELGPSRDERAEMTNWLDIDCSRLEDLQIERLSEDEKHMLLTHAVVLTMADDVQLATEKAIVAKIIERTALPPDVIDTIVADAREDGAVSLPGSALQEEAVMAGTPPGPPPSTPPR
ncbi:MAG TPA: hypothetical protein VM925_36710 [Labilithrix sp.]|nr:hypothetical protein [Labilithrix sp.]